MINERIQFWFHSVYSLIASKSPPFCANAKNRVISFKWSYCGGMKMKLTSDIAKINLSSLTKQMVREFSHLFPFNKHTVCSVVS